MFKVKIDEDEYEVSFWHHIPTDDERQSCEETEFREKFGTICYIEKPDKYIITGISNLSIQDNFNRNVGRKVSLARALQKLFPDDIHGRRLFWREYYKARGNKW